MTKTLTTIFISTLLLLVGCGETDGPAVDIETEVTPVAAKIDSPERLAAEYEKAFKAQDADAVKKLYCWDGVEGRSLQHQEQLSLCTCMYICMLFHLERLVRSVKHQIKLK